MRCILSYCKLGTLDMALRSGSVSRGAAWAARTPTIPILILAIVVVRRVVEQLRGVPAQARQRGEVLAHEDEQRDDEVVREPVAVRLQRDLARGRGHEVG